MPEQSMHAPNAFAHDITVCTTYDVPVPDAACPVCCSPFRFALYNVVGALVWTVLFLGAGFFFGNLPGGLFFVCQ